MSKNLVISVEPNVVHIRHVTLKKVSFVNAPLHYVVSSTVVQKRPPIFIHYDEHEVEMFMNETRKVQQFMSMDTPYECLDSSCVNQEFTEGIPIYMDMELGNRVLGE